MSDKEQPIDEALKLLAAIIAERHLRSKPNEKDTPPAVPDDSDTEADGASTNEE